MKLAPIIIFSYNRPEHLYKTVKALQQNQFANQSDLFVFSDGFKGEADKPLVEKVRYFLRTINTFKSVTIIERKKNYGLAVNIIDGVKQIIDQYGKAIVLEDDLVTSPFFLKFMNEALEVYEKNEDVLSIHGYIYPVKRKMPDTFFLIDPGSLGWATWKNRWDLYEPDGTKLLTELRQKKLTTVFDYDSTYPFTKMLINQTEGKNSSWVIRWYAYALLNKKLTLYPGKSLVFHIGNDGSGTHEGKSGILDVKLSTDPIPVLEQKIVIDKKAREAFKDFFRSIRGNFFNRTVRKLRKIMAYAISKS